MYLCYIGRKKDKYARKCTHFTVSLGRKGIIIPLNNGFDNKIEIIVFLLVNYGMNTSNLSINFSLIFLFEKAFTK